MEIKARFDHFNINVTDLERSLAFYDRALGLKEISRKQADDGSFILAYLGDGETGFRLELTWLRDHAAMKAGKGSEIKAAIADGKTFLTICGGYQMLGSYYRTWDGKQCDFIGAIDYYTVGAKERMIGNTLFECLPESGGSTVVGFENHSGRTYLGKGVEPLGKMIKGCGNNGEDGTEGHGNANKIEVILKFSENCIRLYIIDDGTGCDKIVPDFGLKGMKEKINSIGGNIEFSSLPGNGFSVKAYIPVEVINYD